MKYMKLMGKLKKKRQSVNVGVYLYSITPFSTQCYLNGMSCRPVYCPLVGFGFI